MRVGWLLFGGLLLGIELGFFAGVEISLLHFGADLQAAPHRPLWVVSLLLCGPLYQWMWMWAISRGCRGAKGGPRLCSERQELLLIIAVASFVCLFLVGFGILDDTLRRILLTWGALVLSFAVLLYSLGFLAHSRPKLALLAAVLVAAGGLGLLLVGIVVVSPLLAGGALSIAILGALEVFGLYYERRMRQHEGTASRD